MINSTIPINLPSQIEGTESYASFIMNTKEFTYNIFVPSICDGKFIGMVEFIIDADYFLDYMKQTLGVQTTLFVNTDIYGMRPKFPMICNFQLLSSTLPVSLQSSDSKLTGSVLDRS